MGAYSDDLRLRVMEAYDSARGSSYTKVSGTVGTSG